jgi:tRNA(Arg) A34 adenosine deaminase TadA
MSDACGLESAGSSGVDAAFMREAVRLSRDKMDDGWGGPFGALVVRDGVVIGRGWNQVIRTCDPTAHAEMVAIRAACTTVGAFHIDGAVLYSNCEPCPMCLAAAYWAHVARVVFGCTRSDAAAIGFADEHIYEELARGTGSRRMPMTMLLREEALEAFRAWGRKQDRTPY